MKEWFNDDISSPFMMQVIPIKKSKASEVPAIVHIDGTCRVQSVTEKNNKVQIVKNIKKDFYINYIDYYNNLIIIL